MEQNIVFFPSNSGIPLVDIIPTCVVQKMSHPGISLTLLRWFVYFLCLRWSRVSLRFPTSGDQRMSHPAPVSGPELITTRQLVAGNYLTYHPNGKPNINNILTENTMSITTRSSWLNCALRDDEAVYWVSIGHYEVVTVGN